MKIVQINAVYGHGSTGVIVRDLEELCEKHGIECYVASPDKEILHSKKGILIGDNFDHKLHAILSRINGMQAYYSTKATRGLINRIDTIKPDIVHLHNLHSNFINLNLFLKYLAKKNICTVITLHDCWFYTGGCFHYTYVGCNKWQNQCGKCPKKYSDSPAFLLDHSQKILLDRKKFLLSIPNLYIVGVSEWITNEAGKGLLKESNRQTIRNGIDMEVFKPRVSSIRNKLKLAGKYIILGPVSKWLAPENKACLDYFIQNMNDDEVLLLYGSTSSKQKLPSNVQLYGYTRNRTELSELYSTADVFANVSYEDSLSLINVEAQACGTPVVTFDSTGPKETVDNINSYSVEAGDIKAMLEKIHFIRNRKNTSENTCRDFVIKNFEVSTQYLKYINLYKEIFSRNTNETCC